MSVHAYRSKAVIAVTKEKGRGEGEENKAAGVWGRKKKRGRG